MSSSTTRTILSLLLVVLVFSLIFCSCSPRSKREGYADVFYNADLDGRVLQRPTFNSNLDPRNMDMRSDPYAYGGFIKGNSPNIDNLASYNKIASLQQPQQRLEGAGGGSAIEKFSGVPSMMPSAGASGVGASGVGASYGAPNGMNDALGFINYTDAGFDPSMTMKNPGTNYEVIDGDFADLVAGNKFKAAANSEVARYKASLDNKNPDTLEYTTPQDLLPTPDMRQPLMRDPSDPSNFMYDRTLFAPLKKRNRNEADRIRGDIDIEPIKTGWFDIATIPTVDLVKGYFGYYTDIQQYQDLQDIAYTRARGDDKDKANMRMSAAMTAVSNDMMKPSLKYAAAPKLAFGPMQNAYQNANPWYNTLTGHSKLDFQ